MNRTASFATLSVLLPALAGFAPAAGPVYRVELVDPPGGLESTFAVDLLPGGGLLGYEAPGPFDPLAVPFAWRGGVVLPFQLPTDSLNFPSGGAHPDLVAGSSSNVPFVWKRGVPQALRPAGGFPSGFGQDAGASGAICGAVYNDLTGSQYPAWWPEAAAPGVLLPGAPGLSPEGAAFAMNGRGQIAGVTGGTSGFFVAARWNAPDAVPLLIGPLPGAISSEALDLNERGDVVGRSNYADGRIEAMLFVAETGRATGLGFFGGTFSVAQGINGTGAVVGVASSGADVHAFLWQAGTMHDLNDLVASSSEPFVYLSNAVAIDDEGRIAAEAVVSTPNGPATRMALLTRIKVGH